MIKKRSFFLLLTTLTAAMTLHAENQYLSYDEMTSHLSAEQKATLESTGEVTLFHFDEFNVGLLPPIPQKQHILDQLHSQDMNMGIEGLFLNTDLTAEDFTQDPEGTSLLLYNTIRSVSTLEGTQYYSASREEMRDLFVESWVIPDLDSPDKKMPDRLVDTIPATDSFLIHQKDKSFGNNESLMEFQYEAPVISSVITNKTSMFYNGIIRVIKPERMQLHLVIIPTEKGLLFFGVTAADALNIKAFRKRANNSFYNRVKALYNWYITELE